MVGTYLVPLVMKIFYLLCREFEKIGLGWNNGADYSDSSSDIEDVLLTRP